MAAAADPEAMRFLRRADPVMARLIGARPDFRPWAWKDELPPPIPSGIFSFKF
jgi:hypothetical protein